jgi:hypothetical protein
MVRGVLHYRRKHVQLYKSKRDALKRLNELSDAQRASIKRAPQVVPDLVLAQQATKALGDYPEDLERVMPTKLGNVLRRHEDLTGQAYGLPGVDLIPSLALVSSAERTSHLGEATEQLDVTVSVCTVSGIATLLVAAFTLTDGWWLLLTLLPFTLCLLGYRGAVSVAHSYGLAMRRLVDLERFTLYEALHLPLPRFTSQETVLAKVVASHSRAIPKMRASLIPRIQQRFSGFQRSRVCAPRLRSRSTDESSCRTARRGGAASKPVLDDVCPPEDALA